MNRRFTVARCRVTPRLQWRHRDGFAPSSPSSSACFLLRTPPQVIQRSTLVVNASNPSPRLLSTAHLGGTAYPSPLSCLLPRHPFPSLTPALSRREREKEKYPLPIIPIPTPCPPVPTVPRLLLSGACNPSPPSYPSPPSCPSPLSFPPPPPVIPAVLSGNPSSFFPTTPNAAGICNRTPTPSSLPVPPNSRLHEHPTVI